MSAHCRISRVRMKTGGADVRVLESSAARDLGAFERNVRAVAKSCPTMAGFAIVAWCPDGSSSVALHVGKRSVMPSIMIPDFVRNRLLAERIESWTIETVNDHWGKP